jgi:hypothetical protein
MLNFVCDGVTLLSRFCSEPIVVCNVMGAAIEQANVQWQRANLATTSVVFAHTRIASARFAADSGTSGRHCSLTRRRMGPFAPREGRREGRRQWKKNLEWSEGERMRGANGPIRPSRREAARDYPYVLSPARRPEDTRVWHRLVVNRRRYGGGACGEMRAGEKPTQLKRPAK